MGQESQTKYPTWGNAFRINDQSKKKYPLTLIVHDVKHLELVTKAEEIFWGRYPLGYVGTSPWPGTITNQKIMGYTYSQNIELYDLLREQMEIGWIIYGLDISSEEERDLLALIKDMKKKCPQARQFWLLNKSDKILGAVDRSLQEYGICSVEYEGQQDFGIWLERLVKEIEKAQPPERFDSLEREGAEWTNLSVSLPAEEENNRILLVGDSISAGYGDMVQELMPGWHIDRLNTSEGLHHPNFGRMLEIALKPYSYRVVHINNGIHLHGQSVEQYGKNLLQVFDKIHEIAPEAKIIFATTTPLSRSLREDELDGFNAQHFSMGDRAPMDRSCADKEEFWVTDEQASEIYKKLNETARKICAVSHICVNDLYQLCVDENLQKSDGVHFREDAYWRLAAKVAESLQKEI